MTTLPMHLKELEHRAAVLHLSLQGLRTASASKAGAQVDFDVVVHSADKLRSHIQGVLVAYEDAKGGSRA